jgi:hypothetical protein
MTLLLPARTLLVLASYNGNLESASDAACFLASGSAAWVRLGFLCGQAWSQNSQ